MQTHIKERGQFEVGLAFVMLVAIFVIGLLIWGMSNHSTRHKATVYKTKSHHVVMKDDQGKWWEYVLKNADIDFDIPFNSQGEMVLPSGGGWRPATQQEEEEAESEATNAEQTTVDESTADDGSSSPDGSGDVGGDSGGSDGGGGGDGGGGDGGGDGGGE